MVIGTLILRGFVIWALLGWGSAAFAESRYTLDLSDNASGLLHVTLETECSAYPCDFTLPTWSATYQIRNFSQYAGQVSAATGHEAPIAIHKVEPSRWRIESSPSHVVHLRYTVRATRDGPFGAAVRADRATLNLAQVLLFAPTQRGEPAHIDFTGAPEEFREALALAETADGYQAPSYDRLVDTPVLLAAFEDVRFEVRGKPIRVVAYGPQASDRIDGLRSIARKVVKSGIDLMGDAPFDQFTFVYVFADQGGGGMEYRDGTLIFAPSDCTACGLEELTAHEFFHLWNVKRIRPQSMEPVDWSGPVPSPSLWFAEGVSSTYAQYLNLSAGLQTGQRFLGRLEDLINRLEARPARLTQSAEESSIDAWLEGDAAYHRPDRSISYYLKGELIGYLLDLEIRGRTQNHRSLDDLVRQLNLQYAQQGLLFDDTATLQEIASAITADDMSSVFDQLIRTASPIDWDRYLKHAGFHIEQITKTRRTAGMSLAIPPGRGVIVSDVEPGGAAEAAGFRVGDLLVEIDSQPVVAGAATALARLEMTDSITAVVVERDNLQIALRIQSRQHRVVEHRIVSFAEVATAQLRVREGWLARTTAGESPR